MNGKLVKPKTAITAHESWNMGLIKGYDVVLTGGTYNEESGYTQMSGLDFYTEADGGNRELYNGLTSIFFYIELPDDAEIGLRFYNNFYATGASNQYKTANQYTTFYFLENGSDKWVAKNPVLKDKYNPSGAAYLLALPAGYKGIIRVDYKQFVGEELYKVVSPYAFGTFLAYNAEELEGSIVKMSEPWLVEEYTEEYDPRSFTVETKSEYSEPTQDLTFNVVVDGDLVAAAEAQYGEVVEMGTLLMYTKRLNYRELKIDMADKTGLVTASKAYAADEAVESFTVNLNNIKWSAMGVSVSARAYIKFADGTVIYSKNYSNEFETNAGNARESVIGVAVDAVKAGDFDAAKAAALGYDVAKIQAIANQTSIAGQDRKDLLNFIADCYKQN